MSRTRYTASIDILSHDLLGEFVAEQIDCGMTSRDVCYLLSKPWKWQTEFKLFVCRYVDANRRESSYQKAVRILDAAEGGAS